MGKSTRRVIGFCGLLLVAFAAQAANTKDAKLQEWAVEHGYPRLEQDAAPIYCRVWVPTGTRIEQTECISEQELADRKYRWDHRNLNAR